MRQVEIENQLREVVSRLITEVDLATEQGRLDINLISEDAWIPILKEVYQCPSLINLNRKHKNFPGIDLGDEQDRVAFQITSSIDLEKIKSTLEQFKKRNYKTSFDELYIFTLRKKQKSYSQDVINKIIESDIVFDAKKHIIDPGDILAAVTSLRLPAQERILQEFRTILGDVEISINNINSPASAPYILISNLIKIRPPTTLYAAELLIDEKNILAKAEINFGYKTKYPNKHTVARLAFRNNGYDFNGWVLYENRIFSFYNIEIDTRFKTLIDNGTIEELKSEEIAHHKLFEYQNLFKYLMRDTLRDQLSDFNINWNKDYNQFYFLPTANDNDQRKEEWIGKKLAKRRVYEKKYQTKDPTKVAFFKHLAFDISFINIESNWYATITPTWYYTKNLYKKNYFHDDLLSKQKRLEHNHSVRDQVRFIGYYLTKNCNEKSMIGFDELVEFQCFSNVALEENEELSYSIEEDVDEN